MEHSFSYLFGPHTINIGVKLGWDNQIEVGNKNVNIAGYVLPKLVGEEGEDWGKIENTEGSNIGAACA